MRITHLRQTPLPNTGDSTKVQPSDWNAEHLIDIDIIGDDTAFTVNQNGSGSFTNFYDLFSHLNGLMFMPYTRVSVTAASGIYTINQALTDANPHRLINIKGPTPASVTIASATVPATTPGTRLVEYTISGTIPSSVVPGTVMVIHGNGILGDSQKTGHYGAHVVTSVAGNKITVLNKNVGTLNGFSDGAPEACVITCVIRSLVPLASILSIVGANKGEYNTPYLENIAFDGTGLATFGMRAQAGSTVLLTNSASAYCTAIVNCDTGLLASDNSMISASSKRVTIGSCAMGTLADRNSFIDLSSYPIINACTNTGIGCSYNSSTIATGAFLVDNHTSAAAAKSSSISLTTTVDRFWSQDLVVDSSSTIG